MKRFENILDVLRETPAAVLALKPNGFVSPVI